MTAFSPLINFILNVLIVLSVFFVSFVIFKASRHEDKFTESYHDYLFAIPVVLALLCMIVPVVRIISQLIKWVQNL